ncbi:DUF47 domain-containing protein [Clostridium sp. DJ247]|uniref:DUF47 domain-containing protein n=1 Tax=Clostridium sp. DJ247 TaxID=2726188 RepID=UPI001624065E|nr:DUF47 family protein [Clostridium sp. DJ247]MBC2578989.1 DUF47 family protein [Clostridium sp. DJ247]
MNKNNGSINSKLIRYFFVETANIAYKAANALVEFFKQLDNAEENLKKLKDVEHEGDKKQHEILEQLNKTFITSFDRLTVLQLKTLLLEGFLYVD